MLQVSLFAYVKDEHVTLTVNLSAYESVRLSYEFCCCSFCLFRREVKNNFNTAYCGVSNCTCRPLYHHTKNILRNPSMLVQLLSNSSLIDLLSIFLCPPLFVHFISSLLSPLASSLLSSSPLLSSFLPIFSSLSGMGFQCEFVLHGAAGKHRTQLRPQA